MDEMHEIIDGLTKITNSLFDEVIELKKENDELKNKVVFLQNSVENFVDMQKLLLESVKKNQYEVKMLGETMTRSVDNVAYEIGQGTVPNPVVLSVDETIDEIINNRKSICRFGDGEFSIMQGCSRQKFQRQDDALAKKLTDVFHSHCDEILIAIADNYGSLERYSYMSKNEIRYYMTKEVREGHNNLFEEGRAYFNAYMTTPYMLYGDRNSDEPKKRFDRLKEIWSGRDVIIIEGSLTRFGVGNDIFKDVKSVRRILCPPESAFDKYDEILSSAIKYGGQTKDVLFLISLGPTATVLAYDLAIEGYQAIDIGHADNDYEYFLRHANERVLIPGKYINNMTSTDEVEEISDEQYSNQVIAVILNQ